MTKCLGSWLSVPFGRQLDPVCVDCQRRAIPPIPLAEWKQGVVVDGVCESKLEGEKE